MRKSDQCKEMSYGNQPLASHLAKAMRTVERLESSGFNETPRKRLTELLVGAGMTLEHARNTINALWIAKGLNMAALAYVGQGRTMLTWRNRKMAIPTIDPATIDTSDLPSGSVCVLSLWPPQGGMNKEVVALVPIAVLPAEVAKAFESVDLFHHNGERCIVLGNARMNGDGHYRPSSEYSVADAMKWTAIFATPAPGAAEAEAKAGAKALVEAEKSAKADAALEYQKQRTAEEMRLNTRRNTMFNAGGYLDHQEATIAALEARIASLESRIESESSR